MLTYEKLEKQYESLNNQLRMLFLQNIKERKYDDDTLLALNMLTRELLRLKKMMKNTDVRSPVNYSEFKYDLFV